MILERTNIEARLQAERQKSVQDTPLDALLQEFRIAAPEAQQLPANTFNFDLLDTGRIYHERHIRQICIDYRLRFLDLKYFKPALPEEAQAAISKLENTHNTRLEGLKVMAPSRLFKLEDKDDPLLMAPMGNGYYYLVHKWGNDLHPLRKWLVWPFRNVINLSLLVLLMSYLLTLLVPDGLFSKQGGMAEFWIIFFFMFKSLAAVVIFYGFALGKNFNPAIWNSKYYNA
ncbi:hypothetical protein [Robiginitalea aestuariiviva]|uniref:hypothetical protein n=1 Tax=Robiginitalea aestuariiviva TaxID=3036903 RepID=UPI0030C65A0F